MSKYVEINKELEMLITVKSVTCECGRFLEFEIELDRGEITVDVKKHKCDVIDIDHDE